MTDGGEFEHWLSHTKLAHLVGGNSPSPLCLARRRFRKPQQACSSRRGCGSRWSAEKLTTAVSALLKLSDGEVADKHILTVLQAMEALEARAPLDETPRRVFARQRASAAGRGSGAARNKKADSGWRTHAIELARQQRREAPSLSQESLAAAIEADWQLAGVKPAHETLRKFIASEEKAGRLCPKTKTTKTQPKKMVAN